MAGRYKKGWSADHQKVFDMHHKEGLLPREIVEKTGFSTNKVRNILRSKKFIAFHEKVVENAVDAARKSLEASLTNAAGTIIRLMKEGKPDERLKFDAAKEVLYQCGMKPVEVVETRTRQYTPEELASSLQVVKEIQTIEQHLATTESNFLIKPLVEIEEAPRDEEIEKPTCPLVPATPKANE